ncbi:PAS domain S-box protein [Pseudomonas sp. B21-056]|jgi:PAS domain S-box-containing protein|uniref:PAS domain S-box protein n=1 Tax=Pseudomonas sp. B21-056 TaxID=2895495 RepID=UPI00222F1FAC|nr:PAS domain S-box protein [Pseudomonas sp. B21-056]UZE21536.1 PAS domain S-box protein [Pseudomonas sp. B21-056]
MVHPRLFEATFDMVSCALVLLDGQGRILKVNGAFAELFGYAGSELTGSHFQGLLHGTEGERLQTMHGPDLSTWFADRSVDLRYRHKDGGLLVGRSRLTVVDEVLLAEIVPLEVPQSLGRSMEQNQWLQRIVETAPGIIGIFRLSPDGDVSMPWASPGYEEYYGVTPDELMRDATILFERIHPEDVARVQASIDASARTLSPWQCEYRVHHPVKGEIWLEGRSRPTLEADGSIIWFGFLLDISERKRMEQALLESEERLSLLDFALSHVHEAAFLIDRQARLRYVNDEACRSLGFSRAELLGMTLEEIDPDWTNEQILADWNDAPEHPPQIIESRHQGRDGHVFPVEISVAYLEIDGQSYSLELARDISERRRLQAARQESERRYREVFDNSSDCLYLLEVVQNNQFRYIEVNAAFERSSGLDRHQLIGRCLGDVVPEAGSRVMAELMNCLALGEVTEREAELDLPAGRIALHSTFVPVRDEQGNIYRIVGISRDISESKRMETRLLTSEQQFRALAENSLNLIIRYDLDCRRTYVNPAFERGTGIPAARALQMPLEERWTANMPVAQYQALLRQVIATGEPVETVLEWPSGGDGEVAVHAIQMIAERGAQGAVVSVLAKGYNITALKHHERLLLESEQRYREIFDNSPDSMFLLEVAAKDSFRIIEVNPVLERRLDRERAELVGKTIEQSLSPCAAAASIARYRRCVESGVAIDEEVEFELSSGLEVFHLTLIPIRSVIGRVQRIVGICRNITERKRAERILHTREQEFRALVENTPDVIARFDPQCRFLYANPAAQQMLGRSQMHLLAKTPSEVSPLSRAARSFQRKLEHIIRTGEASEAEFILDAAVAQGTEAACYQVRLVPECDQSGRLVSILTVGRDVSAKRAAERRLKDSHTQLRLLSSHRESTREEERKHIAREIHDELGQQLSALRMGISLLRLQFGAEQPLLVDRVQALMIRVDEIIQVVRNVATSLRPSALNMGLTSALEWLVSEFSQNTGIDCRLSAPPTRLLLDDERATAIFRVIQESLTNVSRHAWASRVSIHLQHDAERLLIEVCDNGKGFDPRQLPKGTLGMLGMRERGHMFGGTVTIDSTPGQGTRVRVNIPFQAGPAPL